MTKVKTAEAPGASEAMVQVVKPLNGFVEQLNAGPLFCVSETNVVLGELGGLGGVPSVIVTFAAADGPAFATVTV